MKPETVMNAVARSFDIKTNQLYAVTRKSEIVEARQVCFFVMRRLLRLSYRVIGKHLVRDHTTVGFGYRQMARRVKRDPVMAKKVSKLEKDLLRKHT